MNEPMMYEEDDNAEQTIRQVLEEAHRDKVVTDFIELVKLYGATDIMCLMDELDSEAVDDLHSYFNVD